MIIHDLNLVSVAFAPAEAYPPLFIDSNAVLTFAAASQGFEPIARRHRQMLQGVAACNTSNFRRALRRMSGGNLRDTSARKMCSVSAHAKLKITKK